MKRKQCIEVSMDNALRYCYLGYSDGKMIPTKSFIQQYLVSFDEIILNEGGLLDVH
ncbi:hypothetical protein OB236_26670 [Paenibacillus sp. WQ 127069]|uniref:Uncharacterized protein n=1 Tax=Paenibacillus baimaensis TaxID=2982185 RepID=A0ABT2UM32_9BACL|nr:hypothetical protein [Paenibacillus sp. WQ 127069]